MNGKLKTSLLVFQCIQYTVGRYMYFLKVVDFIIFYYRVHVVYGSEIPLWILIEQKKTDLENLGICNFWYFRK